MRRNVKFYQQPCGLGIDLPELETLKIPSTFHGMEFFPGLLHKYLLRLFLQFFQGFLQAILRVVSPEIYARIPLRDPAMIAQGAPYT